MNRSYYLAALASGACFALTFAFVACQSSSDTTPNYATGGSSQGGAGGTNNGGTSNGGTSNGGTSNGGSNNGGSNNGGSNNGGSTNGGSGGSAGGGPCMAGQAQTVESIATGAIGSGIAVTFDAIATTAPILAYTSKSKGSCLWAVFVKDPTKDISTMVISYGANMATLADGGVGACDPNPLFEGIQPGDKLNLTGKTSPYAPSTCTADGGVAPALQMQVTMPMADTACLVKSGSGAAPAPLKVTDIDGLASGKAELQGGLIELDNVKAEDWADGGPVGPYGIIEIKGATKTLEIHDKFYYTTEGAPKYASGTTFNKIVGILYLDYCTWAIEPLHKCTDLDPKSTDCP